MARALLKLALLLALVLFGVTYTVASLPLQNAALKAFLLSDGGCRLPCWAGMTPGQTRLEDAIALLKAHPWVARQQVDADISSPNRAGALWWEWNGRQSGYIDGLRDGRLAMENNVIQYIVLQTTVPMGDVQALLGLPERGMIARAGTYPDHVFVYAVYDGLSVRSRVACPVLASDLWHAPVQLTLAPEHTAAAFTTYDLAAWLQSPPCDQ